MTIKQLNESLTNNARSAQDAYPKFGAHSENLPQRTQRKSLKDIRSGRGRRFVMILLSGFLCVLCG
jgi:hypothetical protein